MNLTIDMYQGRDEQDRNFGYVNGGEAGGYFFTWLPTLDQTLDSLDADEMAEPSHDWSAEARTLLATKISHKFAAISDDVAALDTVTYEE